MKQLFTLILFFSLSICFGQPPKTEIKKQKIKLDSVKLNAWEESQVKNYFQGDRAKDKAQIQERISFLQQELQLLIELEAMLSNGILARENKKGQPVGFRNGYLILQRQE